MSPGSRPRPSLSDEGRAVQVASFHVSPGSRPRPSLSEDAEAPARDPVARVAGVSAPAFVERAYTNGRCYVKLVVKAAQDALAPATRRVYASAWKAWTCWCDREGQDALPAAPEAVAAYLAERADDGASKSTLQLARASVRHHHRAAGLVDPCARPGVATVLQGLAKRAATEGHGVTRATGLSATDLAAVRATAPRRRAGPTGRTESRGRAVTRGLVDVALVSVMRDAMLRRGEAAALRWADVSFEADGTARIVIRRSKTDQTGEGFTAFVGKAAAADLQSIRPDQAFTGSARCFGLKSGAQISNRIATAAKAAWLKGRYTGHSPRRGMVADLVAAGASLVAVQSAGRWTSPRMPALYAAGALAGQGAVARYYGGK